MNTSACEKKKERVDEPNFRVLVRLPVRTYCYPIRSREICKGSRKPRCMSLMVFAASQTSNVFGISFPDIVESLDFLVAKFSWHSWIALFREFKSSTKTYLKEKVFLLKLKPGAFTKLHSHCYKQKTHNPRKLPPLPGFNDSTVCGHTVYKLCF